MSSEAYLNPESYDRASLWLKLLFYIGHHARYVVAIAFLAILTVVNYFIFGGLEEALSIGILLGFLGFDSVVPREVRSDAEDYVAHGVPIPGHFKELSEWFSGAFVPASLAAGIGLALVIYGWSAPSGSVFQRGFTAMFAFLTNVCIMSSVSAYSWGRMLDSIVKGKPTRLGGVEILGPTLLFAGATALISVYSGLTFIEDSICTFMPPILIGLYVAAATQTGGFVEPAQVRKRVVELDAEGQGLQQRLEWLPSQKDNYMGKEYETEMEDLNARISKIERDKRLYGESLETYATLVRKVVDSIGRYQERRADRERLLQTQPSQRFDSEAELKMTEALKLVSVVPKKFPPSYVSTRRFRFFRNACTVMDFPIVLSSIGLYLPNVSSAQALELSTSLDRSTFETYAPASFEYFLHLYESAEVTWLWSVLRTKESFGHCHRYVSELVVAIQALVDATQSRRSQFGNITKLDPKAKFADMMESVEGSGPSLRMGTGIASARLRGAEDALQLLGPIS